MELIVISRTRLKIMLTEPDMRRYELSVDADTCAEGRVRASLRRLFEEAYIETGFETEGARLLVQLFACRSGGCEIFVTKLGDPEEEQPLSASEQALLDRVFRDDPEKASPPPVLPAATRPFVLLLADMEPLLAVCRRLADLGYRQDSRAYIVEDGSYCLLLTVPDTGLLRLPSAYAFLREYGEEADAAHMGAYLAEHGQTLCAEEAVQRLGELR